MASDFSAVIADDRSSPDALRCGVTKVAAHVTNRGHRNGARSSVCELGITVERTGSVGGMNESTLMGLLWEPSSSVSALDSEGVDRGKVDVT
jgi:hypothetical protein